MPEEEVTTHAPGWFYKLFGGTLLSLVGVLIVTVISMCYNSINEARQEVNKLAKEQVECVRQKELQDRMQNMWLQVKDATAGRDAAKEKVSGLETMINQQREENKILSKEVQNLRDRVAVMEGKLQKPEKPPE
jgi:septation ring formation regulator EzrA